MDKLLLEKSIQLALIDLVEKMKKEGIYTKNGAIRLMKTDKFRNHTKQYYQLFISEFSNNRSK